MDKVFLLSYQDYRNGDYGFSDNASRQCKATDYAVARGANRDLETSYGGYWTRSPNSSHSNYADYVSASGGTGWGYVGSTEQCVRPAVKVTLGE